MSHMYQISIILMTPWRLVSWRLLSDTQTPCQCLGLDVASVAGVTNDTNSPTHNVSTDMWLVSGGFWVVCDCFNYSIMSRRQRFIDWWLLPNLIGSQCRTHSEDPRRSERVLELQHYNLQLSCLETLNTRWISDWDENWCVTHVVTVFDWKVSKSTEIPQSYKLGPNFRKILLDQIKPSEWVVLWKRPKGHRWMLYWYKYKCIYKD